MIPPKKMRSVSKNEILDELDKLSGVSDSTGPGTKELRTFLCINELARRDQDRQTKWITGMTVAITVMTVVNLVLSFRNCSDRKTVRAASFILIDAQHRKRAELGTFKGEEPSLVLYDDQGKERVELGVSRNEGGGPKPAPFLVLFDAKEKPRALVGVPEEGGALFYAVDESGKSVWRVP